MDITAHYDPYLFFHFKRVCDRGETAEVLRLLGSLSDWEHVVTRFYDQFQRHLSKEELDTSVLGKIAHRTIDAFHDALLKTCSIRVKKQIDAGVIKLLPGQGIGVHTDARPGVVETEVYRLILHFGTDDLTGGELLLLSSAKFSDVRAVLVPKSGDGVAISVSTKSFHAVGEVAKGERYSLVLKCYLDDEPLE